MELLLNFNSVGFLRVAFKAFGIDFKNENDLLEEYDNSLPEPSACTITANKIAGGDYWKDIISEYHDGKLSFYGVEERFVAEYCRRLQKHYQIESLKILHDAGCKTWISMEAYPTPNLIEQNLTEILSAVEFVDKIIFGRTNYSKKVTDFATNKEFYNECAALVLNFCRNHSIVCHIKHGTIT